MEGGRAGEKSEQAVIFPRDFIFCVKQIFTIMLCKENFKLVSWQIFGSVDNDSLFCSNKMHINFLI